MNIYWWWCINHCRVFKHHWPPRCRVASVARLCSHGFSGVWPIRFATTRPASAASVRTLVSLGMLFFFLNTLRTLEAKARHNYVKADELTLHTFQTREWRRTSDAPRGSRQLRRADARPRTGKGGSAHGLHREVFRART